MNIKDRLGYYLVGWKKFYNKTLALIESQTVGYQPLWIFNDDVYSSIDWSVPIDETLESIYTRRAVQLREQYDYLVLYYSGGSDSHNILYTFLKNNIFIDEIVMQIPEMDRNNLNGWDTSGRNVYGEIDAVATPQLQYLKNILNPNTKIRYQDISKPVLELLEKDDWFELHPTGNLISITGGVARQAVNMYDTTILSLASSGKQACQIVGVDKPLVYFDGTDYYAFFADNSAQHCSPVELNRDYYEIFHNHFVTEFFYWTPDMPEIVVKQAQEIKQACELDPSKQLLWTQTFSKHIGEYRTVMHPIIYPGVGTPSFQTDKPPSTIIREMDSWFWEIASSNAKNNYLQVMNYLKDNIESKHGIKNDIHNGIISTNSKFYKL
jgi:hypothetical protein